MKFITFDIEDWFHILDHPETANPHNWTGFESRIEKGVNIILDLMERNHLKGSFFCLGWICEKYPHIIKKINDNGHHIGTHSNLHSLVYNQNKNEFKKDLKKSIDLLEHTTGKKIDSYRAPGFSIKKQNLWAFEILNELGIKYDSSIFPASRSHGGIKSFEIDKPVKILYKNDFSIIELPINTTKFLSSKFVFSGGGYFRLFPKPLLRKLFRKNEYVMTYFHPRDFDNQQPLIPNLGFYRKFKCYYGIKDCLEKLDLILKENKFHKITDINEDELETFKI